MQGKHSATKCQFCVKKIVETCLQASSDSKFFQRLYRQTLLKGEGLERGGLEEEGKGNLT